MRTRTEERRQAILDAAASVFQENGYSRTSMTMISVRFGGSKSTVYGYFPSKEELFTAVMTEMVAEKASRIAADLDSSDGDIHGSLRRFGESYLALVTPERSLAILRTAMAGGFDSKLNSVIYHDGAKTTWGKVARFLGELQDNGLLRRADPDIMLVHLKGLIETGILEPLLFGDAPWIDPEHSVANAIDVFLCFYGIGNTDAKQ